MDETGDPDSMYLGQTKPRDVAGTKEISKKKKKTLFVLKKISTISQFVLVLLGEGLFSSPWCHFNFISSMRRHFKKYFHVIRNFMGFLHD